MAYKIWADGDDFLASDINTYLQKQAVQTFPNASVRNTAITIPTVGMVTFLADTGAIEIYTDKTTPPSWRPPWNTAWGMVYNGLWNNITSYSTTLTWLVRNLPCNIAGRNYKTEIGYNAGPNSVARTEDLRSYDGAALNLDGLWAVPAGWGYRLDLYDHWPGDPAHQIGFQALCDTGTTPVSWTRLRVFDVGPT